MKRARIICRLLPAVLLCIPFIGLQAQDESPDILLTVYSVSVKHGHEAEWREGVKAWTECYAKNGGTQSWQAWKRVQGKGNMFAFTSAADNWAAFGQEDAAGRACHETFSSRMAVHEKGESMTLARRMPAISKEVDGAIAWVTYFRVKNGQVFNQVVENVTKAMREAEEGPRGEWFSVIGGPPDGADYFVVSHHESFAALDKDIPGPWEVVAKVHGQETADEWRSRFMSAVDDIWSFIYQRVDELGYTPPAE